MIVKCSTICKQTRPPGETMILTFSVYRSCSSNENDQNSNYSSVYFVQISNSLVYIGVYMKQSFTLCNCNAHVQLVTPSSLNNDAIRASRASKKYKQVRLNVETNRLLVFVIRRKCTVKKTLK